MTSPEHPIHHRHDVTADEELALLVDAVSDYAMFVLSPTGHIRSWNLGASRIMGYHADEVIGRHFSIFYTAPDLESDKPGYELRRAKEEGRVEDEGLRVRKDGTRFWANTVITALRNPDGSLRGFAKITRDLTERRAAEEELRQSEEMFRLLVDSVRDYAIFMLDPQGYVTTWNAGAQRIKGYTPDEIIGQHFSVFYTPEDIAAGKPEWKLKEAARVGRVEEEGQRVRKDGTRFWANIVINAIYDSNGVLRGFAKVTRDITAKREADDARRALLEQREARLLAEEEKRRAEASYRASQEANRAKDEFLMTLSHELRTPMTAILGWARLLPTLNPADPAFKDAIIAIGRSAQLQAKLIEDVLDVSRIVSGKLRLTIDLHDVVPVLQSAIDAVRPSADAKQITLATSFEANIGAATMDATRLQQIVWNLLTNAIKFTPKRGRVELSARRTASQLQIAVCDTGEGIAPTFLPHVFEPFRQAESPTTRVHGGLGLGLSIVRYLVEAHGGSVVAESEGKGKGAKFIVTLPIRAVRPADTPERVQHFAPVPVHGAALDGRHILVVEDDPEGRAMINAVLRQAGARVTSVDSADAALEQLTHDRPDLIMTDIAMPGMDGFTLHKLIRERQDLASVPVVALTAFPPSAFQASDEEFALYLRKPVDPFELTHRLGELLGNTA